MQAQYVETYVQTPTGDRIAVRDYPSAGPPVVLLHGAGLNLALWEPLAGLLSERYRLVCVDLRGHGASSAVGGFSIPADVKAVEAVVRALDLDRPAIIGHSYGGMVAVRFAGSHPECPVVMNLDGLGGQGRPDHYYGKQRSDVHDFWSPREATMLATVPDVDTGDSEWLDAEIARLLGEEPEPVRVVALPLTRRGFQPSGQARWSRRPDRAFFVAMLKELFHQDVFGAYRDALCPVVLVLASRDDDPSAPARQFMTAYLEGLARAFPTLADALPHRRVLVFDTGHMIPLEDPVALAALIERVVPGSAPQIGQSLTGNRK